VIIAMSETVSVSVKSRTLAWLALGTSVLAGCSVKSSGLGAAKPYPGDAPVATNRPDARSLETGGPRLDGAEGDDVPTMILDADPLDVPAGTGGKSGWDGRQATDGLMGLDGPVGVGGTAETGGVRGSGGALGTGGTQGAGGALVTGGEQGTGGATSLGGAPGTGGAAVADAAADLGIRADAADLAAGDAAAEAGPELPGDVAPDHVDSDTAADLAADLGDDARDARILADGRRDGGRVDVASMSLVWSDEFNAPANTGIDSTKWSYITWLPKTVNNEEQRYTSSLSNVFHDGDGHLVLRARYLPNAVYPYTSGRIDTNQKVSFGPGHRIEVRAKLPAGAGSFPGIIMMGTSGNWPSCGQLSLMEQYGQDKSVVYAAVYAGSAPGSGSTDNTPYVFPDTATASSDFHVYSVDWYSDHVDFWVDGDVVLSSEYAKTSPLYNITEYIILDLALGGDMGGAIDNSAFTADKMDMVVDYVRVYEF
jgi:beta-glucanase (GH16 family)